MSASQKSGTSASIAECTEVLAELKTNGDVIVDRTGYFFFCVVCKAKIPRGKPNLEQHLCGKKHVQNARRLPSDEKERRKALSARISLASPRSSTKKPDNPNGSSTDCPEPGEITSPAINPTTPIAPSLKNVPNVNNNDEQEKRKQTPGPTPVPPPLNVNTPTAEVKKENDDETLADKRSRLRKEKVLLKQKQATDLMNSVKIDKASFLSEILESDADSDSNSNSDSDSDLDTSASKKMRPAKRKLSVLSDVSSKTETEDREVKSNEGDEEKNSKDSGKDVEDSVPPLSSSKPMGSFSDRRASMTTLHFKAPEGPDNFFESIAPETKRTDISHKLQETFDKLSEIKKNQAEESPADKANAESNGHSKKEGGEHRHSNTTEGSNKTADRDESDDFIPFPGNDEKEEQKADEENMAQKELDECIQLVDVNGEILPPWLLDPVSTNNVLYAADSSIALHFEILEFARFMSPTHKENQARQEMIMTIETITKKLWPESKADIFGSYATGLALPDSDVDICVMNTPKGGATEDGGMDEFETLAEAIRNLEGFAKLVRVVKAKVSIVKIISKKTSTNCDVSIGVDNGFKNVSRIKSYITQYPALRPIVLVIKHFLSQRGLNEVYTGGLGSYTIFLLVVSHIQMLPYNFPRAKANLGMVLQSFFELYGRMFNLVTVGIQIKDGGRYLPKLKRYNCSSGEVLRFIVEDPNDADNELGKNGFGAGKVRSAFMHASQSLVEWRRDDGAKSATPLGEVIAMQVEFAKRRNIVIADMEREGAMVLRTQLADADEEKKRRRYSYGDGTNGHGSGSGALRRRTVSPDRRNDREARYPKRRRSGGDGDADDRTGGGGGNYNHHHHYQRHNNDKYDNYAANANRRRGGRPTY